MNYARVYQQLITMAIARNGVNGYYEKHHILPKALGGSNSANNIALLTAREHFIAHMLLAKMHGGNMWYAVICMKGMSNRYINSRLYEIAKKQNAIFVGKNSKHALTGKKKSAAHCNALRLAASTPEAKAKRSASVRAAYKDPTLLQACSNASKAMWQREEVREKMRIAISKSAKIAQNKPETRAKRSAALKAWWAKRKALALSEAKYAQMA